MKKMLFFFVWASLAGCQKKQAAVELKPVETAAANPIIKTAIANAKGDSLYMEFDNAAAKATMRYKGETFVLSQDTMGSGIRYSNTHYIYTEWHGQSTLQKDGQTIFEKP